MNVLHFLMSYATTAANMARSLHRDDRGVSALEYALIASLIGLAIIVGVTAFGTQMNAFYTRLGSKVAVLGT